LSRLEAVRKGIVQLVAIGIVIAVALTLVAVLFQWLPESASEQFDRIQAIYWFVTVISIVIFSLVTAVVVFAVWKWRVPEDDDADGPPIHGHTGLEILWTAVPAVLVTAIGIFSAIVLARNGDAGPRPLEVQAIGQQFAWKFAYPDFADTEGEPVTTGQLVLPLGREARFTMTAVDVIHSFWVPNFGQKMDAVPGIETEILVTPNRMGDFAVVCTELCGLGHATMRAKASVVSPQDFEAWIEEQQA
jgi:cytochrome c oxidase subunit 2